jgi:hypothetical protein
MKIAFTRQGEDGPAIEVLAQGQQFVAFGIHPGTRKPYGWQGQSPVDTPITDLPLTTEVAVRAFLQDAAALAVRAGFTVRSNEAERTKANNSRSDSYTFDEIVDALWHIPNDNLHYDDWVRLGMALKAAVGEAGREVWLKWSTQSSKDKPEFTERKWEKDFNNVSQLSAGTIIYEAKQHGWRGNAKQGSPKTEVLKSINAAQVKMQAVEWIWPNRFAVGKLGILAGMPDEGKGQILCFMAAAITNGGPWPCNEGIAPKGTMLLLTAEDDLADTVVPRLAAAGADLSRVEIVQMVGRNETGGTKKERMFNLVTDLNMLRSKLLVA